MASTNPQGVHETKVNTVDYRSSAGQEQPHKEDVQVVHQTQPGDEKTGGPLASAAAAVKNTVQSAKDAVSGSAGNTKAEETYPFTK